MMSLRKIDVYYFINFLAVFYILSKSLNLIFYEIELAVIFSTNTSVGNFKRKIVLQKQHKVPIAVKANCWCFLKTQKHGQYLL